MTPEALIAKINATPFAGRRRLVAVVGPPASGKSTLADRLAAHSDRFCSLPMDGYHLSNALLDTRDLRARKGAPETFDAQGFVHLVSRLKTESDVYYPTFDRTYDMSINAKGWVSPDIETVIVEGNYLLLNRAPWRALAEYWDLSIQLQVPEKILTERLINRWLDHGLDADAARAKALSNDIPNAKTVAEESLLADVTINQP
jgi:pantothenate kinase